MPGELKPRNFTFGLLLISALIAGAYGVSISAPFVYDDRTSALAKNDPVMLR
jgi:hypothetical protein